MKHLLFTLLLAMGTQCGMSQTLTQWEQMTEGTENAAEPEDAYRFDLASAMTALSAPSTTPMLNNGTPAPEATSMLNGTPSPSATISPDIHATMDITKSYDPPYYKPLDDLTWVGVPIFVAGILAKKEKRAFRQDYKNSSVKTRLVTHFKSSVDDYLQYFSPVLTVGMKIGGVEGRSDWLRFGASAAMSYGIMAGLVNTIKYTAKEMRPDGSTANSWPSGHTATAFVGATILHKEYGLTRSPWFSVLGYSTATATAIMRVLNNRHWVSDVLSGAGIGIMSGELGYMIGDLIFKNRRLKRGMLTNYPDLRRRHPSFFDVSMGIGFGAKELDFGGDKDYKLKFRSATAVQVEGAYFLNTYVGIGGRMRVRTSPIKGWGNFMKLAENDIQETIDEVKEMQDYKDFYDMDGTLDNIIEEKEISIESDHLTEFAGDVGIYFNFPISSRLAIGTKALVGRSIMQALDINAKVKGQVKGMDYDVTLNNGEISDLTNVRFYDTPDSYSDSWDYLTVSGNNSTKWGTGLSLTYSYHGNFCWKIFCDYDHTIKTFTMEYDPSHFTPKACAGLAALNSFFDDSGTTEIKLRKSMNQFVVGASFSVQF